MITSTQQPTPAWSCPACNVPQPATAPRIATPEGEMCLACYSNVFGYDWDRQEDDEDAYRS